MNTKPCVVPPPRYSEIFALRGWHRDGVSENRITVHAIAYNLLGDNIHHRKNSPLPLTRLGVRALHQNNRTTFPERLNLLDSGTLLIQTFAKLLIRWSPGYRGDWPT
jgi:hypothetical protein